MDPNNSLSVIRPNTKYTFKNKRKFNSTTLEIIRSMLMDVRFLADSMAATEYDRSYSDVSNGSEQEIDEVEAAIKCKNACNICGDCMDCMDCEHCYEHPKLNKTSFIVCRNCMDYIPETKGDDMVHWKRCCKICADAWVKDPGCFASAWRKGMKK